MYKRVINFHNFSLLSVDIPKDLKFVIGYHLSRTGVLVYTWGQLLWYGFPRDHVIFHHPTTVLFVDRYDCPHDVHAYRYYRFLKVNHRRREEIAVFVMMTTRSDLGHTVLRGNRCEASFCGDPYSKKKKTIMNNLIFFARKLIFASIPTLITNTRIL